MKKYLFSLSLLLSLLCTTSMAQKQKKVTFNFNDPTSLVTSPALPETIEGAIYLNKYKIIADDIEMSFERLEGANIGAELYKKEADGKTSYYFQLGDRTHWIISGKNGATLNSISYPMTDMSGGLFLVDGQPGAFSSPDHLWTCSTNDASQVIFQSSTGGLYAPQMHSVTITYTVPTNILVPTTDINTESKLPFFKEIKLSFDRNMSLTSASEITLSKGGETFPLSVTAQGNVVTLSATDTIKTDGTYELYVPSRSFTSTDGYQNKELNYTITVETPKNTFCPTDISPAQGKVESFKLPIILTFSKPTKVTTGMKGTLIKDGDVWANDLIFTKIEGESLKVKVSSEGTISDDQLFSEDGQYVVTIPENVVTDGPGEIHNPEMTLKYVIGDEEPTPGPDPEPGVDPEPTETMLAAKALLAKSGSVGYPSATSESHKALLTMTTAETTPTDEALKTAMDKYYKETNITLPENGKLYIIHGENASGTKAYLKYANGKVTLSANQADATTFEAETQGTATAFKTTDGKYLHVLCGDNNYDATSTANVTESYSDINALGIAKLQVEDADATKGFGLVTIKGSLGKHKVNETNGEAYSLILYGEDPTFEIFTNTDLVTPFGNDKSVGFRMTETEKPSNDTLTVETSMALSPSQVSIKALSTTLVLQDVSGTVTRNEKLNATITLADGTPVSSAVTIESTDGSNNTFNVALDACTEEGTYHLILPEGFFTYEQAGKTVKTTANTLVFTVESDFGYLGNPSTNLNTNIKDYELNNFIIYYMTRQLDGLVPDTTKKVFIHMELSKEPTATGHFKQMEKEEINGISYHRIKLELDTPIEAGSLSSGFYSIVYEEATFGDLNFGKFLKAPTSVKKSECKVNKADRWYFSVNETGTGITNAGNAVNKPATIYDLQGRRVEKMTRSGIYIVNGRKVVKK